MKKLFSVLFVLLFFQSIYSQTEADYFNKAAQYMENEQYKNAITYFSKAIDLERNHTDTYHNRAICYLMLKNYSKAINDCDKIISINLLNKATSPDDGIS